MNKVGRIMVMALIVGLFTTLVSCSKNELDGNWEPMKWEADYPGNPKSIDVPAEGGTYTLRCKNYQNPWLSNVSTEHTVIYAGLESQNFHHIEHDWYNIMVEGNAYRIIIKPNTSGKVRKLLIHVTAGDIFDGIEVTQAK